jgi:hypothetical protein
MYDKPTDKGPQGKKPFVAAPAIAMFIVVLLLTVVLVLSLLNIGFSKGFFTIIIGIALLVAVAQLILILRFFGSLGQLIRTAMILSRGSLTSVILSPKR